MIHGDRSTPSPNASSISCTRNPTRPGVPGPTGQTIDNYVGNPEQRRIDNQYDVRVDHAISDANRAFVRYSLRDAWRRIPPALPNGDGGTTAAGTYEIDAHSIAFNDTHILGPRWLNELRIGWSAIDLGYVKVGNGQDIAEQLGIPGINNDPQTSGMVTIACYATCGLSDPAAAPARRTPARGR